MLSYTFYIFGIYVITLTQTAQSFVLLTANLDDVKKLSCKFFSNKTAALITNYVKTLVEEVFREPQKEEEPKRPKQYTRYGFNADYSKHHYDMDDKPKKTNKDNKRSNIQKFKVKGKKDKNNPKNSKRKEHSSIKTEDISDDSNDKRIPNRPYKQKPYKKPNSYIDKENTIAQKNRYVKLQSAPKYPDKDSTIGYAENIFGDSQTYKGVDDMRLDHKLVFNSMEDVIRDVAKKPLSAADFLKDLQRAVDTTTVKERNEFDQYDNMNYPKELIATSGPVALPKMPKEPWWGEDMSSLTTRNKSWF